jgi:threonine dehydratase
MHSINTPQHRLSLANIERAASLIAPIFLNTPQFESEPLSQQLGCALTLKVETVNPLRSFKGRGADFFMHQMSPTLGERALVCASAGNFGQAMAYACRARKRSLVVYAARTANPLKVSRMRALGAEVRMESDDFDAAKELARQHGHDSGALFVEDGFEASIAEGAATIAREMLQRRSFDSVLVPLGDGALITGMGRWIKAHAPDLRVIGVCAQGADAMFASWQESRVVVRDSTRTIADGIAVRAPVPQAVADMAGTVDDVVLVGEESIVRAMQNVFATTGLMLEPAGAVGVAALMEHPQLRSGRVATVLTGANLTEQQVAQWLV